MALYFETPHSSLQPFVNAYILYEQRQPAPSQIGLPLGTQFIWILLEGELMIKSRKKGDLRVPRMVMLGFFTQPFKTSQTFPSKVVAINFKPYACHKLFVPDMLKYQDDFLDLTQAEICKGLFNSSSGTNSTIEIKNILDEWLLTCLSKSTVDISLIQNIIDTINERHGNISVEELLKTFYITERTLERLFNKAVGVNPKLYLRIQRFNYVLSQLENEKQTLQEIIFDAGYFDQPHFIKDFLQFTDCNPSLFKKLDSNDISRQTLAGILKTIS
jgi:AraC-like DNA-binding protein